MLKQIMPIVERQMIPNPPLFGREQIASPELQAARKTICLSCAENQSGICRGCCGGVKIETAIYLNASRCPKNLWP